MLTDLIHAHKRAFLLAGCLIITALLTVLTVTLVDNSRKTAKIDIKVAPASAIITIGGQTYQNGTYKIEPGKYSVTITKDGFTSYQEQLTIQKGETKTVSVALQALSGNDWYSNHPDDDMLQTGITDQQYQADYDQFTTKYPITNYVPYTYTDNNNIILWRIDLTYTRDGGVDTVNINANTCNQTVAQTYWQNAVNWIKTKDINPDDYIITKTDLCDTL